jgi:hypothetical protein
MDIHRFSQHKSTSTMEFIVKGLGLLALWAIIIVAIFTFLSLNSCSRGKRVLVDSPEWRGQGTVLYESWQPNRLVIETDDGNRRTFTGTFSYEVVE